MHGYAETVTALTGAGAFGLWVPAASNPGRL
jgi:hypothetical protein